jgi:hypothetical protein
MNDNAARLAGDGVLEIAIASKLCSYKKPAAIFRIC